MTPESQLYQHYDQTADQSMIQQYLIFIYSLHWGVPIKQVGGADGATKETCLQSCKHRQKTQVNRN